MIVDQSSQNSVEKNCGEKNSSMRRPLSIASGVSETRASARPSDRLRPKRGPCTTWRSRSTMCARSLNGFALLKVKN